MKKYCSLVLVMVLLLTISCGVSPSKLKEAKAKADILFQKIEKEKITDEFKNDYFPQEDVKLNLDALKNKCAFSTKNSVFLNDFVHNHNGKKYIHLLYEFPLKCGFKRIIVTYLAGLSDLKLVGFIIEPTEKDNYMITKPERQLKN